MYLIKKIKKTKGEIIKRLKESRISDENVNKHIEESARKVKNSEENQNSAEILKEIEKLIKGNNCSIAWLGKI